MTAAPAAPSRFRRNAAPRLPRECRPGAGDVTGCGCPPGGSTGHFAFEDARGATASGLPEVVDVDAPDGRTTIGIPFALRYRRSYDVNS